MPDLSFIVPVYKVEKYVAECLASILKIEKFSFEILVIDDASPDRSIAIVKTLFGQDKRLRIIRLPENQGLGAARNEGIRQARGKYLLFIDSDDYIEPVALEYIYDYFIKNQDADVWCNGALKGFQDDKKPKPVSVPKNPPLSLEVWTGQKYFSEKFLKDDRSEASQHYIFKRKFLLDYDLFFKEGLLHEDTEHTPRFHYFASKIIDTNIPFYYHRTRTSSITGQSLNERLPHINKVIEHHNLFIAKIKPENKAFADALYKFLRGNILNVFSYLNISNLDRESFLIYKPYLKISFDTDFRVIIRIILIRYFPSLTILLRKIKLKIKKS